MDLESLEFDPIDHIQVSADRRTVWVHALDGSTVGRFSKQFGIDVHRTMTEQLAGAGQCLACTHEPAAAEDWERFVALMKTHFAIEVPLDAIEPFPTEVGSQVRPRQWG